MTCRPPLHRSRARCQLRLELLRREDELFRRDDDELLRREDEREPELRREPFDDAYHELWQDGSRMPARRYRIQVTDPAFLSHIVPGARWSSAAF